MLCLKILRGMAIDELAAWATEQVPPEDAWRYVLDLIDELETERTRVAELDGELTEQRARVAALESETKYTLCRDSSGVMWVLDADSKALGTVSEFVDPDDQTK